MLHSYIIKPKNLFHKLNGEAAFKTWLKSNQTKKILCNACTRRRINQLFTSYDWNQTKFAKTNSNLSTYLWLQDLTSKCYMAWKEAFDVCRLQDITEDCPGKRVLQCFQICFYIIWRPKCCQLCFDETTFH